MKEPTAYCTGRSIFSVREWKRDGGKRSAIQPRYSAKENCGMPTRKLSGPKPLNGSSQLSVEARFSAKAAILGERGATMPQPKIPTRRNRGPSPSETRIVPQAVLDGISQGSPLATPALLSLGERRGRAGSTGDLQNRRLDQTLAVLVFAG